VTPGSTPPVVSVTVPLSDRFLRESGKWQDQEGADDQDPRNESERH
jgi:hypothetical protein